ncbi:hypothetical protein NPIL_526791 [Nephila pilipes]|uniref:Uncharacterized protein n=1 Tax=Nephila pilipes TaxID=299642 RepID=A0A8X6SZL8_NEPPI|nr:hypothetical protein NPIL_526791 [Nephila pilipes]
MLRLLLPVLFFAYMCVAQEHHHLKIAEKLAIPHHIRHAYEYPQLNLGQALRPAANRNPGFQRQPSGFSQPDPFNQPSAPSSFGSQPSSLGEQQTRVWFEQETVLRKVNMRDSVLRTAFISG